VKKTRSRVSGRSLIHLNVWLRRCAAVAWALVLIAIVMDLREKASRPLPLPLDAVAPAPIPDFLVTRVERPRYRHSVIAGGAYSRDELAAVMREDAVVAAHHEDMDIDRVQPVVTSQPRLAYVSYRLGDRVFWTRKPVHIPAGETLLSDGVREIRARCGNGVSDIAREPVSDVEPIAAELDEVDPGADSSTAGQRTLANTAPIGPAFVPFFHLAQTAAGGADLPSELPEEFIPLFGTAVGLFGYLQDPAGSITGEGTLPLDETEHPGDDTTGLVDDDNPFGDFDPDAPGDPGGDDGDPGVGGEDPGDTPPGIYPPPDDPGDPNDPNDDDGDIPSVPEPGVFMLLGLGLAAAVRRRR
jgi:MYXO-CTERM domain-containing protein